MRPQRRGRPGVTYPQGFPKELITVPETARYIFLVFVLTAKELSSGGRLTRAQITAAMPGTKHLKRYLDHLCSAGLLRSEAEEDEYQVVDREKWISNVEPYQSAWADNSQDRQSAWAKSGLSSAQARPKLGPSSAQTPSQNGHKSAQARPKVDDVSPGQDDVEDAPRAQGWARSPAQPRAGSFEVPSSTRTDGTPKVGRDAPRSGGGAARPARKTEVKTNPIEVPEIPPEGVTMRDGGGYLACQAIIKRAQSTSPHSTGTSVRFSKYPDKPPAEIPKPNLFGPGPE